MGAVTRYNEFHFQTVVRTRIRKPGKEELLAERYHDLRERPKTP